MCLRSRSKRTKVRWKVARVSPAARLVNGILEIKMAQHLESRCILLSGPSTFGAGGPTKASVESSIKKFNPCSNI